MKVIPYAWCFISTKIIYKSYNCDKIVKYLILDRKVLI